MDNHTTQALWSQFGAAIDMLENAITACPDHVWDKPVPVGIDRNHDSETPMEGTATVAGKREGVMGAAPGMSKFHEYWYMAYHTLFFLDYYMSETEEGFAPPEPFTLSELDPAGALPDRVYTKDELLTYLGHGRAKARATVEAMISHPKGGAPGTSSHPKGGAPGTSVDPAHERAGFTRPEVSRFELALYVLRHVQHHAAQLHFMLRQALDEAPRWVGTAG